MIKVEFTCDNVADLKSEITALFGTTTTAPVVGVDIKTKAAKAKTEEIKMLDETKTDTGKVVDMKPDAATALDADAIEKRRITLRQLNSEKTTAGFKAEVKAVYAKYSAANVSTAEPKDFDAIEADLKALGV